MTQLAGFRFSNAAETPGTETTGAGAVFAADIPQSTQQTTPPPSSHTAHAEFVEKLVGPWSSKPFVVSNEIHEVRPVAVRPHEVPTSSDHDRRTSFAVHWGNIYVNEFGELTCACCDALQVATTDYREAVALMYRRWIMRSTSCRAKWRRQGFTAKQITAKSIQLRQKLFPIRGFFNEAMAAASDEELMVYVCSYSDMSHSFRVCEDQPTSYRWTSVFDPTMRQVCQELLRPFRAEAEKAAMPVMHSLAQLNAHGDGEDATHRDGGQRSDSSRDEQVDFVGALTPAGLVVGFAYVVE